MLPPRDISREWQLACLALDSFGCRSLRARLLRMISSDSLVYDPSRLKVIHGDFHHGNLHFDGDRVSGIMDFEDFRLGYPAEDWVRYLLVGAEHLHWFDFVGCARIRAFFRRLLPLYPIDEWRLALNAFVVRKMRRRFAKPHAAFKKFFLAQKMRFRFAFYRALREDVERADRTEKILVIKHGALGDFLFASGSLRGVRARHPNARIALITEAFLKGFAESMGIFDEVVVDSRGYDMKVWWRVIKRTIADRKWDAIYDFQNSNRTLCRYYPLALLATRHSMRWGHGTENGFVFRTNTRKLPWIPWFWTNVAGDFSSLPIDLSMCHGPGKHFDELPEKYVLVIPGCSAGNEQKRWPPEKFREVTMHLADRGYRSVVIGTKAEAKEIGIVCRNNPNAIDFLGKSEIADLPDLARRARLVIGGDTGPSHFAHMAGAPTILLFPDYYYRISSFKNKPNVVCLHQERISDISLQEVIDAVEKNSEQSQYEK